jgi:hypothetical protein
VFSCIGRCSFTAPTACKQLHQQQRIGCAAGETAYSGNKNHDIVKDLAGKVAVVTGAATGIGRAAALLYAGHKPYKVTRVVIHENEEARFITIRKPGLRQSSVTADLQGNILTLKAEQDHQGGMRINNQPFSYSLAVPDRLIRDGISLLYGGNTLRLVFPNKS